MPKGFKKVEFGNLDSVKEAITENTAAIIIEPVQGEGGVNALDSEFIKYIDKVTKEDIIKVAKKYLTLDKYALSTTRANNCKPVNNQISKIQNTEKPKLVQQVNNTKKVLL